MRNAQCCEGCCYNLGTVCRLNYRAIKDNKPVKRGCPLDWSTPLIIRGHHLLKDEEWLREHYIERNKTFKTLLNQIKCTQGELQKALKNFNIFKRG